MSWLPRFGVARNTEGQIFQYTFLTLTPDHVFLPSLYCPRWIGVKGSLFKTVVREVYALLGR
jgi:hypothetical protein